MSISDCTVGEGNSAHFFRYFFLKPNDPLTQWLGEDRKLTESVSQIWPSTEYAKNLTEFVEEWPSVRIFSPSPSSRSRYYFSRRVFCRKLTDSPSPLPSTESTASTAVHRVHYRPPSHGSSHRVIIFLTECLVGNSPSHRVNRVHRVTGFLTESGGLTKMKWNKMKFEMLPVTIATLACVRNIFVFLFHCILSLSFISSVSSRLYEVSWTKDRDECTAMTSLTASSIKPQVERGSVVFSMRNKIFWCYAKA